MNAEIKKLIAAAGHLNPIAPVGFKLLEVLNDQENDLRQVTGLVETDPAIVANLLRAANSAYYALPREVDTVQRAVVYLGLHRVFEIVFMQSLAGRLKKDCSAYRQSAQDIWRHAVCSAFLAREIGETVKYANLGMLFTAALVKDIGKIVLHQYLPGKIELILEKVAEQGICFDEAEQQVLGISHPEIGAQVAEKWDLPESIVEVIRHHHSVDDQANQAVSIVQISGYIISMMGIGAGIDGMVYRIAPGAGKLLSDAELQKSMISFLQKKDSLYEMAGAF